MCSHGSIIQCTHMIHHLSGVALLCQVGAAQHLLPQPQIRRPMWAREGGGAGEEGQDQEEEGGG